MKNKLQELIARGPVFAAVKDDGDLEEALHSDCTVIFLLYGTICNVGSLVKKVKEAGKVCFVHADLIEGLALKETAAQFLSENTEADGIISTKLAVIRAAKERGLMTVHRCFLLDSKSLEAFIRQLSAEEADCVEVLPGVMPKVIRRVVEASKVPVIAGGLISDKEDAMTTLSAGADGISTTCRAVWGS